MMSGTRKLPPISTSSPREMTASRPSAELLSASTSAAAQLFTTSASSAPVSSVRSAVQCAWRDPRAPVAMSYSSVEKPCATSRMASRARSASGARPRLVCKITPVALMTRRSVDCWRRASASPMARTHAASSTGAAIDASRALSTTERTASVTSSRGATVSRWRTPSSSRSVPTAGSARRGSVSHGLRTFVAVESRLLAVHCRAVFWRRLPDDDLFGARRMVHVSREPDRVAHAERRELVVRQRLREVEDELGQRRGARRLRQLDLLDRVARRP